MGGARFPKVNVARLIGLVRRLTSDGGGGPRVVPAVVAADLHYPERAMRCTCSRCRMGSSLLLR
jgi:hypothetical protein